MTEKNIDRIMSILFLLFVFIFYIINETYPVKVKGYTQWLLILLGLCAFYILLQTWNKKIEDKTFGKINLRRILIILLLLILYTIGLYFIGYFPMTVFFITFSLILLGNRKWLDILLTNLILLSLMYILFIVFLKIKLPIGSIFGG